MPSEPIHFEILVVDDDKIVSLLHKNLLKFDHLQPPVLFRDGNKALEHLCQKNAAQNCFLILLDLNMPVINGWDFLNQVKESDFNCTVFVVLVTSSIYKKDQMKALEYEHVIGFCEKPLQKEHIAKIKNLEELQQFFKVEKMISTLLE